MLPAANQIVMQMISIMSDTNQTCTKKFHLHKKTLYMENDLRQIEFSLVNVYVGFVAQRLVSVWQGRAVHAVVVEGAGGTGGSISCVPEEWPGTRQGFALEVST